MNRGADSLYIISTICEVRKVSDSLRKACSSGYGPHTLHLSRFKGRPEKTSPKFQ